MFVPIVDVRTVLGTLGTSEGLSWGVISLLDDVYFRTVNFVMQSCNPLHGTADYVSHFSGKQSLDVIHAFSFVEHVRSVHVRSSSSVSAIRVSVYEILCYETLGLCSVERACLAFCAPPLLACRI